MGRNQEIMALYERDVAVEASYRAGLRAGEEAVDWRGWLQDRVAGWPDVPLRATMLANLDHPHYHDDWEMLPDYWR